jgi:phytoene synthase
MDRTVAHGRAVIERGSLSFAAAARLFDPPTRAGAYLLYAWCRHCDDVTDGQALGFHGAPLPPEEARRRVDGLRRDTLQALDGDPTDDPVFAGLARVVVEHAIPRRHPLEHLDGFVMDVDRRRYHTLDDTLEYCYHVAGVVGVMMAYIMGVRDDATLDRASDLGIAFQLTNICRDVMEDAQVGRVYLPEDWLAEAGVPAGQDPPAAAVQRPEHRQRVFAVIQRVLAVADRFYESSWFGISQLPPRSAWAVAAAKAVYGDIGRLIASRGPESLDRRAATSRGRKLALVLRAGGQAWAARTWGKGPHDRPRDGLWSRPQVS